METFECIINKNGGYYILNIDFDVLKFLDNLNDADFIDDQINLPLVVEELPVLCNTNDDVSSPIKYIVLMCPPHHKKIQLMCLHTNHLIKMKIKVKMRELVALGVER